MRVAMVQLVSTTDPDTNLEVVRTKAAEAAALGAELVVFPEATMCSFARPRAEAAEPFDGPWAQRVRGIAEALGVTIIVGMFTTTSGTRVRNTLLVTGPGVDARYDKLHLFDALGYAESRQIEAGAHPVAVTISGAQVGLATCYDIRFPELFLHYAREGADVIVVPASWAAGPHKIHQWRTLATARAMDSTCFVVACGQADPGDAFGERKPTGVGHSMVVDPLGTVLIELGPEPGLCVIDLDLAIVADARARLPVLQHARKF